MEYSLWGELQHSIKLVRGMRLVLTPSHGGIIVSKKFAEKTYQMLYLKEEWFMANITLMRKIVTMEYLYLK